jgi:hypothetical protein
MGMLSLQSTPNLPLPPAAYSREYLNALNNVLRLFFNNINAVQVLSLAGLNLDLNTLPTEANIAILRIGDVYRDTTADNALKVKV